MKRTAASRGASSTAPTKKERRQLSIATFEKWQREFNREHDTLSGLRCNKDRESRGLVDCLWCEVCRKYEKRICSSKNFSKVCL